MESEKSCSSIAIFQNKIKEENLNFSNDFFYYFKFI